MRSWRRTVVLTATAGMLTASGLALPSAVAVADGSCVQAQGVYTNGVPWAQNLIDAPRIWPLTTGSGVTVAVLGTGVDADNAQFGPGQVKPAITMTSGVDGSADCAGYGTFAAGIVAAQQNSSTTFAGVAPGAHILPIRYTDSGPGTDDQGGDPTGLASAIDAAVSAHASVILVAVPATTDDPTLRSAVQAANAAGDVVIAPAIGSDSGDTSYPAADPGAIGVAPVNTAGNAVKSETGDYLALAAPGVNLVGTAANTNGAVGQVWSLADPSFAAAAYVAGVVALMRAYPPLSGLSPQQIRDRLTSTASPAAGANLGAGVVNAYAAVTAQLSGSSVGAAPVVHVQPAPADNAAAPADRIAGLIAVLAVLAAGVVLVVARSVRRARARGWRVGRIS